MISKIKRPLLIASIISCICSVICYNVRSLSLILAAIFLCLLFLSFILKWGVKISAILLFVTITLIGSLEIYRKSDLLNSYNAQPFYAEFVATEECVNYNSFSKVTVRSTKNSSIPKNTKLFLQYDSTAYIAAGDIFRAKVTFSGLEDSDYKDYYYSNGVFVNAKAETIQRLDNENKFYSFTALVRNFVKDTALIYFDDDISATLIALTIGDKTLLSSTYAENIKAVGISHVIVVSGLHLAIIMSAIFSITDKFSKNRFLRSFIALFSVFMIIAVCGFTMSIIRAGIMFVVASLAPIFNRENDTLNSLGTAVTLVVITFPFVVFNVSFQLSVLATLAVVWVAPFYNNLFLTKLKIKSTILKTLFGILFSSFFATIFTMPVVIKSFGYVSLIAPLTNLLITYPVSWALTFNLLGLIFEAIPLISVISAPFFLISGLCAKYIVAVVNGLAKMPITVVNLYDGAFYFSLALIFFFIFFILFYEKFIFNKKLLKEWE